MPNTYSHIDFYNEEEFEVNAEKGYVEDFDIQINTNDKHLSFRMTKEQAMILFQAFRDELDFN